MKKLISFIILLLIFLFTTPICNAEQLIGPCGGDISSLFGNRIHPILGGERFHKGLDIAANYGGPVYALQNGYVIKAGNYGDYGLMVMLDHYPEAPGIPRVQTLYGHNSKILVKVGQYVTRGQVIAQIGSTGRSTGPHLHFEVHYKGAMVDPIDYLRKLPSYLDYIARYQQSTKYASYNKRK